MSQSTNLALPYLGASQSQKHVTVNEGLRFLDVLVQIAVKTADIPEPPVTPVSVQGDLWQLGSHRLICGDSTAADVVGRLLGDTRSPCPPMVAYSAADQVSAAEEVGALPESVVVVAMLSDYAVLRDQARACR